MEKVVRILILAMSLSFMGKAFAQNDLDSALVVNEIAGEDEGSDTIGSNTWTFNNGATTVTVDTLSDDWDGDIEELEEIFEHIFDGNFKGFEHIGRGFEKFGWIFALIPILICFFLPLLIIFLIVFFTYKGRKAKYRAYQQMAENGQPIPNETQRAFQNEDDKLRADGLRNICVGIGLAIFLGLLLDEVGIGIGALVAFIGLGKYLVWYSGNKDRRKADNNDRNTKDLGSYK